MKPQETGHGKWTENVIIADADYVNRVAFDLTVNFERMIGRKIPRADMGQWAVCVALDGGLREGTHQTQLVLIHDKKRTGMENFVPSGFDKELNGQAFRDARLGEFLISSYPVEELTGKDEFMLEVLKAVLAQKEVKRIMVVPNAEEGSLYDEIRSLLHALDDEEKHITVFTMQPLQGGRFRQELLGYSLMSALGIKSNEIK